MNKSLLIPKIEELDTIALESSITKLEEQGAKISIDELNWASQYPYKPLTVVNAAHSGKALYLDFFVRCNYLRAINFENNSPVWEDSSVVFVIQSNDNSGYKTFNFNCIGTVAGSHHKPDGTMTKFTDEEIIAISRSASCGHNPFREIEGLFTWNVAVKIPFELAGIDYSHAPVILKGNFGKCASGTSQPHFLTWNPVAFPDPLVDLPQFFGDIILE